MKNVISSIRRAAMILALGIGGHARAQELIPPPVPSSDVVPQVPIANSPTNANLPPLPAQVTPSLLDVVRELGEQRHELVSQVEAAEQNTIHADSSRRRVQRDVAELIRKLERQDEDVGDRARRLQDKIDRLRKLIEVRGARQDSGHSHEISTASPAHASDGDVETKSPKADAETGGANAVLPAQLEASSAGVTSDLSPTTSNLTPDPPEDLRVSDAIVQAVSMVDEPVDRLGFANNLYATGEFSLALEIYRKIDRSGVDPGEWLWIEYQVANCYRRLGKPLEAERGFRVVTSRDKESWIGQNARWWLDVGDRTKRLKSRLNNLEQQLDQLESK